MMRIFGRLVAALSAAAAGACQFPYPADVPDDDAPTTRALGGTVTGLWTGGSVSLHLAAGDVEEDLAVAAGEPFTFTRRVLDGASYLVTVTDDGPDHDCALTNGSGRVDGADITDLELACTNQIGHGVAISTPVPFTFDPRVTRYPLAVSILQQEVSVTVTGATLTGARVAGQAVTLGQPSPPVPLGQGMTTVDIDVIKGPLSQRYQLVFDRGAAPITETLRAPGRGSFDFAGVSVASAGDMLAFGAPEEDGSDETGGDDNVPGSGAVYIYRRNGASWSFLQTLKGTLISVNRGFGKALAMTEDTLVVGADVDDGRAVNAGAVYVFRLDAGSGRWIESQRLTASDAHENDRVGTAVAVSGDLMAVGAVGHDHGGTTTQFGQVYTWRRSGGTWTEGPTLRAASPQVQDAFGVRLALDGERLAVGMTDPNGAFGFGPVATFRWTGASWAAVPLAPTRRAASLAIDGDVLVLGNPEDGVAGTIRAYEWTGSGWNESATMQASTPVAGTWLGLSVAIRDNVVASGSSTGALQAFQRIAGGWLATPPLPATVTAGDQFFGGAIALTGNSVAIGSSRENSSTGLVWGFR